MQELRVCRGVREKYYTRYRLIVTRDNKIAFRGYVFVTKDVDGSESGLSMPVWLMKLVFFIIHRHYDIPDGWEKMLRKAVHNRDGDNVRLVLPPLDKTG